jgi:hypothetical protein
VGGGGQAGAGGGTDEHAAAAEGSKAVLHDSEGKTVAQTTLRGYGAIGEGSQVIVGSWELEVEGVLDGDKFR